MAATPRLVLLATLLLTGCSNGAGSGSGAHVATAAPTTMPSGAPAPSMTLRTNDKPSASKVDLALNVVGEPPGLAKPFTVTLSVIPHIQIQDAHARATTSGRLRLVGDAQVTWPVVAREEPRTLDLTCVVDGPGFAELRVEVEATTAQAGGGVGSTTLYLMAADDEVLVGKDGPTDLRLRHLDHQRALGRLSATDYERLRNDALSGG